MHSIITFLLKISIILFLPIALLSGIAYILDSAKTKGSSRPEDDYPSGLKNLFVIAIAILVFVTIYSFQLVRVSRIIWFVFGVAITIWVVRIVVKAKKKDSAGIAFRFLLLLLLYGGPIPFWILFIPEMISSRLERRSNPETKVQLQQPLALMENVNTCCNYREHQVRAKALEFASRLNNESANSVICAATLYQNSLESISLKNMFVSEFKRAASTQGIHIETETKTIRVPMIGF